MRRGKALKVAGSVLALASVALLAGCEEGAGPGAQADGGAQTGFVLPAGCTHLATVQQRSCSVVQVLSCGPQPADRTLHRSENGKPLTLTDLHRGLLEVSVARIGATSRVEVAYASRAPADAFAPSDPEAKFQVAGKVADTGTGVTLDFREAWIGSAGSQPLSGRTLLGLERHRLLASGDQRQLNVAQIFWDAGLGAPVGIFEALGVNGEDRTARGRDDRRPVSIAMPGEAGFGSITPAVECPSPATGAPQGTAPAG